MAKRTKYEPTQLHSDTVIEVIAIKGNEVVKKNTTYGEALKIKKKKGWQYLFYQVGFSQFNKR